MCARVCASASALHKYPIACTVMKNSASVNFLGWWRTHRTNCTAFIYAQMMATVLTPQLAANAERHDIERTILPSLVQL